MYLLVGVCYLLVGEMGELVLAFFFLFSLNQLNIKNK